MSWRRTVAHLASLKAEQGFTRPRIRQRRRRCISPFVAPIEGVGEKLWALAWRSVLEELGMLRDREPYGAVCPAPTSEGGFTKRPLTSAEASSMLNDFLGVAPTA